MTLFCYEILILLKKKKKQRHCFIQDLRQEQRMMYKDKSVADLQKVPISQFFCSTCDPPGRTGRIRFCFVITSCSAITSINLKGVFFLSLPPFALCMAPICLENIGTCPLKVKAAQQCPLGVWQHSKYLRYTAPSRQDRIHHD